MSEASEVGESVSDWVQQKLFVYSLSGVRCPLPAARCPSRPCARRVRRATLAVKQYVVADNTSSNNGIALHISSPTASLTRTPMLPCCDASSSI